MCELFNSCDNNTNPRDHLYCDIENGYSTKLFKKYLGNSDHNMYDCMPKLCTSKL